MADFTPTQGRYRAFIRAYTNLHGYPPAESEIAAAICVSPPSVNQMVKALEKKGLIQRQPGQPRSIQVRIPEDEIPLWNGRKQAKKREAAHPIRRRTAAEKRARREQKRKSTTIFINGKQKRVPRPQLIQGLPVEEFIANNADPLWLHENGLWEFMTPDDET
jgi:SOS-response transcriptional repressor LexA